MAARPRKHGMNRGKALAEIFADEDSDVSDFLSVQMNRRKMIYFNYGEIYEDTIDHRSYAQNNSGLNGTRTHNLCDTGGVLLISVRPKFLSDRGKI